MVTSGVKCDNQVISPAIPIRHHVYRQPSLLKHSMVASGTKSDIQVIISAIQLILYHVYLESSLRQHSMVIGDKWSQVCA